MEVADYRRMNTFELIDRINNTVTWDDEENEPCMRELCERYNVDFDAYDNYEGIWDQVITTWEEILWKKYMLMYLFIISTRLMTETIQLSLWVRMTGQNLLWLMIFMRRLCLMCMKSGPCRNAKST